MKKITIKEASKIMNKSEQFIRIGLQRGILPIGNAVKMSDKKWTYYISPKLLQDYTGMILLEKE